MRGNVSCDVDRKNEVTVDDGVGGSEPWMGDVCGCEYEEWSEGAGLGGGDGEKLDLLSATP